MSESSHSPVGASSAYRWMACPGSVRLGKSMPKTQSRYAMEGVAAHQLAETCLRKGQDANEFLGTTLTIEGGCFEVSEEMAEGVQVYLDAVWGDLQPGDALAIEERFDLNHFYPGMFGTNDCSIYRSSTGLLIVYDFKYGAGVAVAAEANPQLLYYGLGAATAVPGRNLSAVELVVVQPRGQHRDGPVRRWRTSALELLEWSADLVDAVRATEVADAPLHQGAHCKFCPAAAICPALRAHVLATAQMEFGDQPVVPETLSGEALAVVLTQADVIENWLTSVRAYAHQEAEAGRTPPGFKLVNKQGRRVWIDPDAAIVLLRGMGLEEADIHKAPEMLSPAQIEAVLRRQKKDTKVIVPLVVSRSSGTTLVHESNARPAVASSAVQDFQGK
ncbi:MAG: DUF2800 domain-containing protein [Magnetococcus sp. YQC-9]